MEDILKKAIQHLNHNYSIMFYSCNMSVYCFLHNYGYAVIFHCSYQAVFAFTFLNKEIYMHCPYIYSLHDYFFLH